MTHLILYKITPWFLACACLIALLLCISRTAFSSKAWNLSNTNPFFVGREEKLKEIEIFFKKGGSRLALTGGPGFGKTQIAKQYAQIFQNTYDLVWWIDTQQDIPHQFQKLALALNDILLEKEKINTAALSKDALVDRVKDILRMKAMKYLLVFDGAETYDQIEKYIPYIHKHSKQHILVTSRYANIWPDRVEIGPFKREESLAFINKSLPKSKQEEREKLAETLDDYPLGLTLAVGFIKSAPTATIKKYLALHMKRTLKNKSSPPSTLLDQYANDAETALALSLTSIEEQSKEALQTLFFMSLLNSKDIPESYVELWLKKNKSALTADEAIKSIYEQSLVGVSETLPLNKDQVSPQNEGFHYLSLHDLTHRLINGKIPPEESILLINKAAEVMLEVFSGPSEVFIAKVMKEPIHLLHARKLCENARKLHHSTSALLQLKICVFESLMGPLRDFEAAKTCAEEIKADLKAGLRVSPYYEALFKVNNGLFESAYNTSYVNAIRDTQESLDILETLEGYNEEKLRGFTNISQYYCLLGETAKAEEFISKGTSLFSHSNSLVYNALFLFSWSYFLNDRGEFKKALQTLDKAKPYSTLETEYPTMVHALLHQRIESLIKLNQLDKSWKAAEEYEQKLRDFFPSSKISVFANCFLFKGLILIHKGESIDQALHYLNEALQIYRDFFQGDTKHRRQALAHFACGKAYALKKELGKALEEYLLSEQIYNKILKNKKIDDVSELYKELVFLSVSLKDEQLVHTYLKAHLKIFGLLHPRTQEMLAYLDKQGLEVPF